MQSKHLRRVAKQPIKSIAPIAMRRTQILRPVSIPLHVGGTFHGILPEAITTNIWRNGVHESAVTKVFGEILQAGDTFIDIGAHFGYFSIVAAQHIGDGGRIVAFEAMPETFGYLLRNLQDLAPSTLAEQIAVFDRETITEFSDAGIVSSSLNSAFQRRGTNLTTARQTSVPVQTETLDRLVARSGIDAVSLIKIDAESSEEAILRGATDVIETHKPAIVMELGDSGPPADGSASASTRILRFLAEFGYIARTLSGEPFTLTAGWTPYANVVLRRD